ncbi:RagB/SusD family nutrient uptake outer membrane protein [Psychroflexus aestuariivivens]|uniref:RagB/SusD family nutrient uptake outer membrane protein n=1 Tax=Psychroflexus aestuariivivens TaxID=1795040 RepID=UPI00186559C1
MVAETAYQNLEDLDQGLNGVYTGLNLNNTIEFNSIFTDNCKIGTNNGGQALNLLNQILNTQTNSAGIWNNRYQVANRANRILAASEIISYDVNDQSQVNQFENIIGQAYALRAFSHFEILTYYGEDLLDPTSLGIVYQTEVNQEGQPLRLTMGESIQAILDDLDLAESLVSNNQTNKSLVTQDFITFVRARLALYTGDYPEAQARATDIINNYTLANQTQYQAMFSGTDRTEVIFAYEARQGFNRNIANLWIFTGTGGNFVGMSNELFDELAAAGDVRFAVNFNPDSDLGAGEIGINKYPGSGGQFINDFKVMRASEAYLIRAEAYARQNELILAADDVQAVKNARSGSSAPSAAYTSANEALRAILSERRLELCFEGHRYIDIKRYRLDLNEGLERDPRDCEGNIPCNIPVNDRRWTFPIPQGELNANTNIQQNPEWL